MMIDEFKVLVGVGEKIDTWDLFGKGDYLA